VDKEQPLVSIATLDQNLADFIAPQRFNTALMTIFAAIGLSLAALGVFSVMSYRVARRTREIGLRMALGAQRGQVLRAVLAEAMRTAAAGVAAGWLGAWLLTRYLASLLFGVKAGDPLTLSAMTVLLIGAAAAASYLPAWRASRLDPISALREE
jgi:putative ABC transport system permease protein